MSVRQFRMLEDEKHFRVWKTGPSYIMFEGSIQGAHKKVQILNKVRPKNLSYDVGLALWCMRRERKNWHHASCELVPSCHCNKYLRNLKEGRTGNMLSSGREFNYHGENKEGIYFGSWFQSCCYKPLKVTLDGKGHFAKKAAHLLVSGKQHLL